MTQRWEHLWAIWDRATAGWLELDGRKPAVFLSRREATDWLDARALDRYLVIRKMVPARAASESR